MADPTQPELLKIDPPMSQKLNIRAMKMTESGVASVWDTSRLRIGRHSPENRLKCLKAVKFKLTNEIGKDIIKSKQTMKVLGVIFDARLTWENHIQHTIAKCGSKLSVLRKIRRKFTFEDFQKLITSQYFSQLYYCWLIPTLKANLKKLVNTAHYKALRISLYDFKKKIPRHELTKRCKRASPSEWGKYAHASFVIKCLQHNAPNHLAVKIRETLFATRREPEIGKFFNISKGKIGMQSIQNRLKFMDSFMEPWLGKEIPDNSRRRMLKRVLFDYLTQNWYSVLCPFISTNLL